jgi:site-specific recombinase XerD
MKILEEQMEKTDSELVFPDEDGQMRSNDFRTEMKNAAKKAGLRKIRFHDLRHTFASNFVIKGGNLLSLQKILGHSTISMTLRYAHLAPDFMASEIEVLDFESRRSPDGPRKEVYS